MKLINYELQKQMENLSELKSKDFFKDYIQSILEDEKKPYYQKCDYVGLSLHELKLKIDNLSTNIKDLQALKKKLSNALEIAKELTAEVLVNNGIDRVDGNIISSLTLSKETSKTSDVVTIKDPNAVMGLGYVNFSVDVKAVEEAIKTKDGRIQLDNFIEVIPMTVVTPAKVKVNAKKNSSNSTNETDEILIIEQKAA
jgi:uncharacterized protein YeeX (DUF496 family)